MPWVRLDDHFDENLKMAEVGPLGLALWVSALAYCNRNLTDGFIPLSVARTLIDLTGHFVTGDPPGSEGDVGWTTKLTIDSLVNARLWDAVSGGYQVHDFAAYQPSRVQVLEERRKAADRQAKHRSQDESLPVSRPKSQRESQPDSAVTSALPVPVPVPVSVPKESSPLPPDETDSLNTWYRLTASWPSPRVRPWISQLDDDFGSEDVSRVMAEKWIESPDKSNLLSRVRDELEREAHQAERQRLVRVAKHEAEEKARIESMPPEQRKANLVRLRDMLTDSGVLSKVKS